MRLWIFVSIVTWGLIACTPDNIATRPALLPTGSPIQLNAYDATMSMDALPAGWQTYTTEDHVVLTHRVNEMQDVVINLWFPQIELTDERNLMNVVFEIASMMEDEQDLRVTRPTSATWGSYDAAYFLITNGNPYASMIVVVDMGDGTVVGVNIRGVDANFITLREPLLTMFESFTVNEVVLGNDLFRTIPDTLMLPARNPEAALDPSAEP